MSAAHWFIAIGLFAVAAAGSVLAYRVTHTPPAPVTLTCAAPPAPVVTITPPPETPQIKAPEHAPIDQGAVVKVKTKPKANKPSSVKKLKSQWSAPAPFKLEDLFNAR